MDEVINYVMNTPGNTNPNVLKGLLNKVDSGGSDYTLEERTKLLFPDGGNTINFAPSPNMMDMYAAQVWIGDNVPGDKPEDWPESMDVIFDGVSYTIPRYSESSIGFNISYGYGTVNEIGDEIPDFSQAPIMFGVMYDLHETKYQYGLVFVTDSTESSHSIFISYKAKEAVPSKEFEEARGFVANKIEIIPDQIVKNGDVLNVNVAEFSKIAQKLGGLLPLWITYNGETSKVYPATNKVDTIFYPLTLDDSIIIDRSNFSARFEGMSGESFISACYVEEPEVDPDFIEATLKANKPLMLPVNLTDAGDNGYMDRLYFYRFKELLKAFESGRRLAVTGTILNTPFTIELTTIFADQMLSGYTTAILPNSNSTAVGISIYVIPDLDNPDTGSPMVICRLSTLTPFVFD